MNEHILAIGARLLLAAICATLGVGCCTGPLTPPPCTIGTIGCPPSPQAPVGKWPGCTPYIQNDEQNAVYYAVTAFSVLPTDTQNTYRGRFTQTLTSVNDADQTYINTINAIAQAGKGDYGPAVASITSAVVDIRNLIAEFEGSTGSQPDIAAKVSNHKAQVAAIVQHMNAPTAQCQYSPP